MGSKYWSGARCMRTTIEEVYKEMKIAGRTGWRRRIKLVQLYDRLYTGDLDTFQVISRWKNYVLNQLTDAYFMKA